MPYVTSNAYPIQAMAQIHNQSAPYVPLETFDITLGAYGSVGRFTCTTAISALASYGWGPHNLLGVEIENSQPYLADGSPSYPIKLYTTGAYDGKLYLAFTGDIDELSWNFDNDKLTITGRDYAGRLLDWKAVLTPKWVNMNYYQFVQAIFQGIKIPPTKYHIATQASVNDSLGNILYGLGNEAGQVGKVSYGYAHSGLPTETSYFSLPEDMWNLLTLVSRAIGFIVTVHTDGTFYVGPQGGDAAVNYGTRTFTWFAPEGTPNVTPVRHLVINHGPRQYGTFVVRGFSYHPPSVQVTKAVAVGLAGSTNATQVSIPALAKQQLTAGVYKSGQIAAAVEDGKPNYFFYYHGQTQTQVERDTLGIAFDIARHLYIVEGEIDGDPSLQVTTPILLSDMSGGNLQGYTTKPLTIAGINHMFDMSGGEDGGFVTRFRAWYEPPVGTLPAEPGVTQVEVTG